MAPERSDAQSMGGPIEIPEELLRLAYTDVTVAAYFRLYRSGELSYLKMLEELVIAQTTITERLAKNALFAARYCTKPTLITEKPHDGKR